MIFDNTKLRLDTEHQLRPAYGQPVILGWREKVYLPNFDSQGLIAKIDSGAIYSSLHALDLQSRWKGSSLRVSFQTRHAAGWSNSFRRYSARVIDHITVRSSHGTLEKRYVIETTLRLGDHQHEIKLSLTDRSSMQFALLIGRDSLPPNFLIDCSRSFMTSESLSN